MSLKKYVIIIDFDYYVALLLKIKSYLKINIKWRLLLNALYFTISTVRVEVVDFSVHSFCFHSCSYFYVIIIIILCVFHPFVLSDSFSFFFTYFAFIYVRLTIAMSLVYRGLRFLFSSLMFRVSFPCFCVFFMCFTSFSLSYHHD